MTALPRNYAANLISAHLPFFSEYFTKDKKKVMQILFVFCFVSDPVYVNFSVYIHLH